MKSRHLVHPELAPYLAALPVFDFTPEALPRLREAFAAMPALHAPETDATRAVRRAELRIPGPAGAPPVRVLVYRPAERGVAAPAVLHIHGGGHVLGAPEMNDLRNRFVAADLGAVVVSVDYRLAPETRFPGSLEDAYAALRWLHASAEELGVDRARIALLGESAGGGLAAGLALLARDRGEVPLCFQLLVYPMLDDRTASASDPSPHPFTGEYIWTPAANRFGWEALLGHAPGTGDVPVYAAPGRATELAGLPPTFLAVGALDLFLDEDLAFAARLARAGVPTELHVLPGAFHGFDMLPGTAVGATFAGLAHAALRRALLGG